MQLSTFRLLPDHSGAATKLSPVNYQLKCQRSTAWTGLCAEDFVRVTGVPDAVSAGASGYRAIAASRQGALSLAELALRE